MSPIEIAVIALLVLWVLYRQVAGRFVRPIGRAIVVPVVIVGAGLVTMVQAHPPVTAAGLLVVGLALAATTGLGVVRATAIRLELREGWLYQRGGLAMAALWVLTIGVRVGMEFLGYTVGAGPLLTTTLALSLGLSLVVQYLVLTRRVAADGRPVRRDAGRARDRRQATL
ncbi:MAG: hypothetical protein L0I76_22850 [Pseudonocardia sp.]|nr:hypothetical protein [Pseudonocardia sp.]